MRTLFIVALEVSKTITLVCVCHEQGMYTSLPSPNSYHFTVTNDHYGPFTDLCRTLHCPFESPTLEQLRIDTTLMTILLGKNGSVDALHLSWTFSAGPLCLSDGV